MDIMDSRVLMELMDLPALKHCGSRGSGSRDSALQW